MKKTILLSLVVLFAVVCNIGFVKAQTQPTSGVICTGWNYNDQQMVFVPDNPEYFDSILDMQPRFGTSDEDAVSTSYTGVMKSASEFNIHIPVTFPLTSLSNGDDIFVYIKEKNVIIGFQGDIFLYYANGDVKRCKAHAGDYQLMTHISLGRGSRAAITLLDYTFSPPADINAWKSKANFQVPIFNQ